MTLPTSVGTCLLTWTASKAIVDSADLDRDPDMVPIEGARVSVFGSIPRIVATDPFPITISLEVIVGETDADGVLIGPDGMPGIRIVATDNPTVNPKDFTYTITIDGAGPQMSFSIAAPAGGEIDLSSVVPVKLSSGTSITPVKGDPGPAGKSAYQSALDAGFVGTESAWIASLEGDPGLPGDPGNDGLGFTGGSYESTTGVVTFTSDDGLGFVTGDLRGEPGLPGDDGLGWTGASYDANTGQVTFTSNDGLEFVTGDLRGTDGSSAGTIVPRGEWNSGATYVTNDIVDVGNEAFIAIATSIGVDPTILGGADIFDGLLAGSGSYGSGNQYVGVAFEVTEEMVIDRVGMLPDNTAGAIMNQVRVFEWDGVTSFSYDVPGVGATLLAETIAPFEESIDVGFKFGQLNNEITLVPGQKYVVFGYRASGATNSLRYLSLPVTSVNQKLLVSGASLTGTAVATQNFSSVQVWPFAIGHTTDPWVKFSGTPVGSIASPSSSELATTQDVVDYTDAAVAAIPKDAYPRGPWKVGANYYTGDLVTRATKGFMAKENNAGSDPLSAFTLSLPIEVDDTIPTTYYGTYEQYRQDFTVERPVDVWAFSFGQDFSPYNTAIEIMIVIKPASSAVAAWDTDFVVGNPSAILAGPITVDMTSGQPYALLDDFITLLPGVEYSMYVHGGAQDYRGDRVITPNSDVITPNGFIKFAVGGSASKTADLQYEYANRYMPIRLYEEASPWAYIGGGQPAGITANRPTTPSIADQFFDTTLGKPIWYDGTNWVDAAGTIV